MSAYLIGHITVNNSDKWKTYIEGVQKSLIPFEAEEEWILNKTRKYQTPEK
jgi:hypothetical protein